MALLGTAAFAERPGTAAQLIKATDLKKTPLENAANLGRLPRGTVMTLTGLQKNGFVGVEVELADGAVKGWVPTNVLNRSVREALPENPSQTITQGDEEADDEPVEGTKSRRSDDNDEDEILQRPRSRLRVPKDEGVLLRRDDSFFYGIFGGGGVSLMISDASANTFPGPNFGGGGFAGYVFSTSFAIQGEVGYALFNGDDPAGAIPSLSFGFITMEATLIYAIDRFELHGGIGYYYGLSLSNTPPGLAIGSAADLSTITFHAGGAFRIPLGDVVSLSIAGRFMRGLISSPVGISSMKAMAFLQFRG